MNYEELLTTPEFQKLHPIKQQIIKEVASNSQNASIESMLPKIMSINKELSKRNLNFTKTETNLLISILKEGMTPAEQKKVDMLMGFFH